MLSSDGDIYGQHADVSRHDVRRTPDLGRIRDHVPVVVRRNVGASGFEVLIPELPDRRAPLSGDICSRHHDADPLEPGNPLLGGELPDPAISGNAVSYTH